MKKATSVVDETVRKRLAFAGILMSHVGVLPESIIDKFSLNEYRKEIPDRLLYAFEREELPDKQPKNGTGVELVTNSVIIRPHIEILCETPLPCARRSIEDQVAGMERMYKMLGWNWNIAGLAIPPRRKGFDRLVVMGGIALSNNRGYDACEASFPSYRYLKDLDLNVPTNERHPKNGVYAVWFRDRVEADEELAGKSARDIETMGMNTITLLEREVLELVYFMETGKHLDIDNITLCSGSRGSDGDVPGADWDDDRFEVDYYLPDGRNPGLRSREAVSL